VLPPLKGAGADLGCGFGALSTVVLRVAAVTALRLVEVDRRAVEAAKRNVDDARAGFDWADVRTLEGAGDLNFIVSNPPFHDGGDEDRRLGPGLHPQGGRDAEEGRNRLDRRQPPPAL
jgi:16S rRNA (guanine1207-N2)-methyltransferase